MRFWLRLNQGASALDLRKTKKEKAELSVLFMPFLKALYHFVSQTG